MPATERDEARQALRVIGAFALMLLPKVAAVGGCWMLAIDVIATLEGQSVPGLLWLVDAPLACGLVWLAYWSPLARSLGRSFASQARWFRQTAQARYTPPAGL
jgi:hypothetical protein